MNQWKARPTTYRGIQMRSRLEAAWAEQFDAMGEVWQYEPRCFASEEGQYLPDFVLKWSDEPPQDLYIEVKPWSWFDDDSPWALCRMFRIIRATVSNARFWVVSSACPDDELLRVMAVVPSDSGGETFGSVDLSSSAVRPVPSLHAKGFYSSRMVA